MNARTRANLSDFSAGIATVSTTILPAYFGRNFLLIHNNGPGTAAVNLRGGTAALNTNGNVNLASGQRMLFQKNVPQNAITAISASTSQLTVQSDDSFTFPSFIFQTSPFPYLDLNFQTGNYWAYGRIISDPTTILTTTHATTVSTNLLPISAAGTSFTTFATGAPRITSGLGLLVEEARTNNLLNSTVPATQTTASLGTGTYTLWCNGSVGGTATASVGTATAPALPLAASQGSPIQFTITVAGTITVTVAGSLNSFQLETGNFGTSLIITAGATATRPADSVQLTNPVIIGAQSTLFAQGTPQAALSSGTNQVPIAFDDGTAANRFGIVRNNANNQMFGLLSNAGVTTTPTDGALATNSKGKMSLVAANSDQAFVLNGGTIVTAAASWPPTAAMSQMHFGNLQGNNSFWNSYIERIVLWPVTRIDNATMQGLTT